ncbi:glycogen-debranching protein [Pseudoclavibacter chungangensis]|uniref:Glycogen-debranching protein n=1 Tax=Pseudoclavibacter chungangensis TaxID=587635 RepID=A0A7J5BYW7_9MICO|nr:isoamylase [Pseudoclavibacter chungangensis]KAB1659558.1 glycogen-debranching protein [Pseudoclavibacter chungangensis]NYJ67373.1 glycogen operon protein [Pseudoclavibacter chungangensis]
MHLTQRTTDLGVTHGPDGPQLRVWSGNATAIHLCLLDEHGSIIGRGPLERGLDDVWSVVSDGLVPGARYAIQVDGPEGVRHDFDGERLLLDPYAHGVENLGTAAEPRWCAVVLDDAPFDWQGVEPPRRALGDVVIYEAHVKGLTKLAPWAGERAGSYAALGSPELVSHLTRLGVGAVELLPIHAFDSEPFLRAQDRVNYWGYNTLAFFAPHPAYASGPGEAGRAAQAALELKQAVRALHAAGIEVYLDVVYNHTAEGGRDGDTTSFRGIDHENYYRVDDDGFPIDVTGCGNSLDTSHPVVQQLVLDSLIMWVEEYHIDGFRFDLAAELGRDGNTTFVRDHPLLNAIVEEPRLADAKIIAEPWDVGFGGWQTGNFPDGWSEWNDGYRDRLRSFWVGDVADARRDGQAPRGTSDLATAIAGSSDLFANSRGPLASVNFVTAHDGFTLRDLVSYNVKHNLLNMELGRDGTNDNRSYNFGFEGDTDDPRIIAARGRAMRNLVATLLISAGVPMITAGDEFARTQRGNNNAYVQDNPISWIDWSVRPDAEAFCAQVAQLVSLRNAHPVLRPQAYNHGRDLVEHETRIDWFDALGRPMSPETWGSSSTRTVQALIWTLVADEPDDRPTEPDTPPARALQDGDTLRVPDGYHVDAMLLVLHGSEDEVIVRLPETEGVSRFETVWDSSLESPSPANAGPTLTGRSEVRLDGPTVRLHVAVV